MKRLWSTKARRAYGTIALGLLAASGAALGGCSPRETGQSPSVATAGADASTAAGQDASAGAFDVDHGKQLFMKVCASCHGATGQGLPHQGVNLRTSEFVTKHDNEHLLHFIRTGRQPNDPATREGLVMPPRGGDPTLDDESLRDVVAYLRVMRGA
jgi:mono/diheme cytochrome c family protein